MTKKKVSKKAALPTEAERDEAVRTALRLMEKNAVRITELEKRQTIIIDGLSFMADNCRTMFNMTGLAVVIDAVVAKFK